MTQQEQLEHITEKQLETNRDVSRILDILESKPELDTKGLVERVNDNTKGIADTKQFQENLKTTIVVTGGVAGFFTSLIVAIASFLIKFKS